MTNFCETGHVKVRRPRVGETKEKPKQTGPFTSARKKTVSFVLEIHIQIVCNSITD